jgi:Tripartite tricarboxylate transporter TctB family
MFRLKSPQDLGAAVMFLLFGLAGLWFGREYEMGTASRMGPGYMPMVLSGGLIGLGIVVGLRAVTRCGPAIEPVLWRTNGLVLGAILGFVVLIESAGLASATFVVSVLSALASAEWRWRETLALGVLLAIFCVLVFIYALRQPMSVFGSG